jgi:hypothetical protein
VKWALYHLNHTSSLRVIILTHSSVFAAFFWRVKDGSLNNVKSNYTPHPKAKPLVLGRFRMSFPAQIPLLGKYELKLQITKKNKEINTIMQN